MCASGEESWKVEEQNEKKDNISTPFYLFTLFILSTFLILSPCAYITHLNKKCKFLIFKHLIEIQKYIQKGAHIISVQLNEFSQGDYIQVTKGPKQYFGFFLSFTLDFQHYSVYFLFYFSF